MSSPPWSSPCRPRAPPAADGCIDGSQSPGPDPVLPAAPPPGALLEHSGHPGKAAGLQDAPLGGGPILARPTHRPRRTRRLLRATPRQAATPGPTSLRALTRVSSCATRARPSLPTTPDGPHGSAFLLTTGSVFLLGSTPALLCSRARGAPPCGFLWSRKAPTSAGPALADVVCRGRG